MEYKTFPPELSVPWTLCFKLFSKLCINFFDESYYKDWKLYFIALCALIHNITMWLFMSKIFTEKINMFEVAYMISVCVVSIQAFIKSTISIYKKSDIETLINELATMWRTTNLTDEQIKTKNHLMKKLELHQTIYYWTNMFGAWLHLIAPLIVVIFRRLVLRDNCKLTLAFGSVFPFDPTDNWVIYLGIYGFQTFSMIHVVYGLIGSDFLIITFCGNLAIEFALLRADLEHVIPIIKLNNLPDQPSLAQRINTEAYSIISIEEIIRRHQRLMRLGMKLDEMFNGMILMSLLCVTIIVCFFGFAITIARGFVETANNIVAVLAMLLPLYIFCYYGELMNNESLSVADSAYNNPWYKGDAKFQRTIVLIIARSQKACCLTSWKLVPVTLNMFAKVSSTAWSYFSLVNSVYTSNEESKEV